MARVSKSKKFRGTPNVGKLPASATVSAATSDSGSDSNGSTDRLPENVSLSKLRLTRAAKALVEPDVPGAGPSTSTATESVILATGYRLIDVSVLEEATRNGVHRCANGTLKIVELYNARSGLCSNLAFQCTRCSRQTSFYSSAKRDVSKGGVSYDVNRRAAYAMKELALGREGMTKFCDIFDMPPPSSGKSWSLHNRSITETGKTVLREHLLQAGQRFREFHRAGDPSLGETSTIDVAVTVDGTWAKRGFTSNFGVVPAMSVDTGEIIDVAVMSKYCDECANWSWLRQDAFTQWKAEHVARGDCDQNHAESSPAMEMRAAVLMWGRSLQLHNLRYRYYVSDGDSKGFSAVSELNPYDDLVVEKIDCVNHVGKRMGTGLRTIVLVVQ